MGTFAAAIHITRSMPSGLVSEEYTSEMTQPTVG